MTFVENKKYVQWWAK